MVGRKPKPVEIKKLQGNPGRRPIPDVKKTIPITNMHAPDWFGEIAKKEWKRILKIFRNIELITEADKGMLQGLCIHYERWIEAEKKTANPIIPIYKENKEGEKVIDKYVTNPFVKIAALYYNQYKSACIEFGLTPVSRTRLGIVSEKDDEDEIAKFLKRKATNE